MAQKVVAGVLKNSILVGKIVPSTLTGAHKVQVPYFVFDNRLKAFFNHHQEFIASDPSNESKTGDVVVIQKIENMVQKEITHFISETMYKCGDVKDPISGEYVVGSRTRAQMKEIEELYGATGNFDYETAPERGRLAETQDFTDRPVYRKWHEFEKDDPYGIRN
eukprot:TRINITY_DN30837_c0_g1_i2.p1 TRINITY_DN30837_c0_g1~~TRINITY_DN30837_c0_g1_i2.p1  ORF type:complete len:164 (+),score=30.54 TRINITY_DN30837_c0_g1_i2:50-541(+)